jgi:hypothetical protein
MQDRFAKEERHATQRGCAYKAKVGRRSSPLVQAKYLGCLPNNSSIYIFEAFVSQHTTGWPAIPSGKDSYSTTFLSVHHGGLASISGDRRDHALFRIRYSNNGSTEQLSAGDQSHARPSYRLDRRRMCQRLLCSNLVGIPDEQ